MGRVSGKSPACTRSQSSRAHSAVTRRASVTSLPNTSVRVAESRKEIACNSLIWIHQNRRSTGSSLERRSATASTFRASITLVPPKLGAPSAHSSKPSRLPRVGSDHSAR